MEASADLLSHLHDVMATNMWGVYLCLFVAPFVQEDAAVIAAASLSLAGMGENAAIFLVAASGLISSDLWKYWIGRAAQTSGWARRMATRPEVAAARNVVGRRLAIAMLAARFLPGARIALYIAAGYFGAGFVRFALLVGLTAILYVGAVFALFHAVGSVAGEQAKVWLPAAMLLALAAALLIRRRRTANRPTETEDETDCGTDCGTDGATAG